MTTSEKVEAIRKRVHDRMFAAQEAATEEYDSNGATNEYDTLQEEANWLATILADLDAAFWPDRPILQHLEID